MRMHTRIHACMHACIHAPTHTHTHTHTQESENHPQDAWRHVRHAMPRPRAAGRHGDEHMESWVRHLSRSMVRALRSLRVRKHCDGWLQEWHLAAYLKCDLTHVRQVVMQSLRGDSQFYFLSEADRQGRLWVGVIQSRAADKADAAAGGDLDVDVAEAQVDVFEVDDINSRNTSQRPCRSRRHRRYRRGHQNRRASRRAVGVPPEAGLSVL